MLLVPSPSLAKRSVLTLCARLFFTGSGSRQCAAAVADRTARLARWQQPHRRRRAAGPRRPCAIRTHHRLFRVLVPLTGDRAPWQRGAWLPAFLGALAHEAEDGLDLLVSMERV
jgi:hypothetical protein